MRKHEDFHEQEKMILMLFRVLIGIIILVLFTFMFMFKSCVTEKIKPVKFKEVNYPTNFNKL